MQPRRDLSAGVFHAPGWPLADDESPPDGPQWRSRAWAGGCPRRPAGLPSPIGRTATSGLYTQSVHRIPDTDDTVVSYIINIGRALFPIVGIVVSSLTSSGKQGGGLVLCPGCGYRAIHPRFPSPHVENPANPHALVTCWQRSAAIGAPWAACGKVAISAGGRSGPVGGQASRPGTKLGCGYSPTDSRQRAASWRPGPVHGSRGGRRCRLVAGRGHPRGRAGA